jgi:hypothetical protein
VGGRVGLKGVNAVHLRGILKEVRKSNAGVLEDVSLNQLLQCQGAVVDEGCLSEFINSGLCRLIFGIAKKSAQQVLKCGEEGGKVTCHAKRGEGTAAVTSKVVRNVLLFKGWGKFFFKIAGVSETTTIKPAGRSWSIQIRESVRGSIGLLYLGKGKVAIDSKEPSQSREAIACTLKDGWGVQTGGGDHDRKCG